MKEDMKKEYQAPEMTVVEISMEGSILKSSIKIHDEEWDVDTDEQY